MTIRNPKLVALSTVVLAAVAGNAVAEEATITFAVPSSWESGYSGTILIENDGAVAIDGWELQYQFGPEISSLWNGDWSTDHEGARTALHLQYVVRGGPTNVDSLRELQCVKVWKYSLSHFVVTVFVRRVCCLRKFHFERDRVVVPGVQARVRIALACRWLSTA